MASKKEKDLNAKKKKIQPDLRAPTSILNSLMKFLKYHRLLLLFTHFLVFPLWVFSSSESINSCNTASLAMSAILNYRMSEFLNF